MTRTATEPIDKQQRDAALDIESSVIVQAPAGSGKTELLTKRFLKLLAAVEAPEQILAITFTRAATAEMRQRILDYLEKAQSSPAHESEGDETLLLARRALSHAERLGWDLLSQPHRLQIETVDSFCLRLAQKAPLISRLGGVLNPTENATPLYRLAARRTLEGIGSANPELSQAVTALLEARDNNLAECESLLVKMLARRDQWFREFVLDPTSYVNEEALREKLERPMVRAAEKTLQLAYSSLSAVPALDDLLKLARYACGNLDNAAAVWPLRDLSALPEPSIQEIDCWKAFPCFLLTKENQWRKMVNKRDGFPPQQLLDGKKPTEAFKELVSLLQSNEELLETLCELRNLPPTRFSEKQWDFLRHLFYTLRHASAQLRVVFAEKNQVDFVELSMAASLVLGGSSHEDEAPSDIALAAGERIRHLLFDEFQDTSRSQHQLLEQLLKTWNAQGGQVDDGRTCFIVGDPMQSIYAFRQAEVELFQQVQQNGFATEGDRLIPKSLKLHQNFRSGPALVEQMNTVFASVFGENSAVPFVEAAPTEQDFGPGIYKVHAGFYHRDSAEERDRARSKQCQEIIEIAKEQLPIIKEAARQNQEYRVAILARAGKHLMEIAQQLRDSHIPFRAVEMEQLGERQEILDLKSLVQALVDPMDRISWLSILRSPWCGLTLQDLHILCGADTEDLRDSSVEELTRTRIEKLSSDGQQRLKRLQSVIEQYRKVRFSNASLGFGSRIERVWYSLGGDACIDETGRENIQLFFALLDKLPNGELSILNGELTEYLAALCSQPDPHVSERCGIQLMTIHKSKGLGFHTVIVPALDRATSGNKQELLLWLERAVTERTKDEEVTEILLAPIQQKGEDEDPLQPWVRKQIAARDAEERKRLLYVAATRARKELHLFGLASLDKEDNLQLPKNGTLLATAWPALEKDFLQQYENYKLQTKTPSEATVGADPNPTVALHRLPLNFSLSSPQENIATASLVEVNEQQEEPLFDRPEASVRARLYGNTVHALLEQLTHQLAENPLEEALASIPLLQNEAILLLRQGGMGDHEAEHLAEKVLGDLEAVLQDPHGRWVLSPHLDAASELKCMGVFQDTVQTLQLDRVFRAGKEIGSEEGDVWWIVDYKTTQPHQQSLEEFLKHEEATYRDQLKAYVQVLRLLHGPRICVQTALYFPLVRVLHLCQTSSPE